MSKNKCQVTIAMYPNCHGIGYVIYEDLDTIIDIGIKPVERKSIKDFVSKADWLLDFYQPEVIVLRDNIQDNRPYKRVQKGIQKIIDKIKVRDLTYHVYTPWHIQNTFSDFGVSTKYERSKLLASWFTMLKGRVPKERKVGDAEDYQMTLFDAFALMIVHMDQQKLKNNTAMVLF